jgi:hypothetical protein
LLLIGWSQLAPPTLFCRFNSFSIAPVLTCLPNLTYLCLPDFIQPFTSVTLLFSGLDLFLFILYLSGGVCFTLGPNVRGLGWEGV